MIQAVDQVALLPLYAAGGTAVLVLLLDLLTGRRGAVLAGALAGTAATAAAAVAVAVRGPAATFCTGDLCSWVATPAAAVAAVVFAGLTAAVLGLSAPALRRGAAPPGEYCFLLSCATAGGVTVAYAGDLLTLVVGLETLTLPLFVLVGLRRYAPGVAPRVAPAAASVTFFLVGVVSTAVALLGVALRYAATGTLYPAAPQDAPAPLAALAAAGAALLVAGLAFKVAAVPLHAWAPATYDGAPLPVAAYLSTASKLGGVLALVAVVARIDAGPTVAVLAVATMTVGNLAALRQTRTVRLLAFSSVAQAGYVLAALAVGERGTAAALAYTVFFTALELTAFAAVVALRPAEADGGELAELRGAGRRRPWPAAALVLALAGLAGLPPGLAGLFAKVTVVGTLVGTGAGWLAAVVAVNAVVALAYYVRVAALLYARPDTDVARPAVPWPVGAALLAAAVVAVALGVVPQLLFDALS